MTNTRRRTSGRQALSTLMQSLSLEKSTFLESEKPCRSAKMVMHCCSGASCAARSQMSRTSRCMPSVGSCLFKFLSFTNTNGVPSMAYPTKWTRSALRKLRAPTGSTGASCARRAMSPFTMATASSTTCLRATRKRLSFTIFSSGKCCCIASRPGSSLASATTASGSCSLQSSGTSEAERPSVGPSAADRSGEQLMSCRRAGRPPRGAEDASRLSGEGPGSAPNPRAATMRSMLSQ
mmetsp:Transcript_20919/g.58024  ORF Transcript_20919/g.58024 Transcript_20919/m.58024 type:complete len:236 (+) Transcript_20919:340-1047(+)